MELRKEILKNCFVSSGRALRVKHPPEIVDEVMRATAFLPEDTKLSDRIYAVLNAQTKNNHCLTCGKVLKPKAYNPQLYCGVKCGSSALSTVDKRRETCQKKYGVDNIRQADHVKEKAKTTCTVRFGVDNPLKSAAVKKKVIDTNLERYGVEWTLANEGVQDKGRQTCLDKYGVENAGQAPEVRAKILETNLERYGAGTKSPLTTDQLDILRSKEKLESSYKENNSVAIQTASKLGVSVMTVWNYLYKHNIEVIKQGNKPSTEELDLHQFITDNYSGPVVFNTKQLIPPYEIDIYLPELKLAIEYNGVYWHCEGQGKGRNYHLNKTVECAKQGIQLLHVFSTDDIHIWKSVILLKLGGGTRIYGRETTVVDVDPIESASFVAANHLQRNAHASIHKGLRHNGQLIAIMTFAKSRWSYIGEHELIRFCTLRGHRVVGGASKLLSHSPIDSCISYANIRWSDGNLYEKLGFILHDQTSPNYFYTQNYTELYSRMKFQKHRLGRLLSNFDPSLSEHRNMLNNGWDRIFDCGNLLYTWKR